MPWPLLFPPRRHRDLPHLALSISLAAGRPACLSHREGHLLHLYSLPGTFLSGSQVTFHSQKTIQILRRVSTLEGKMCEHIIRKKSEVEKCGQRMNELGLGHRKRLHPPPSLGPPSTPHASWGASPSAAWASSLRAACSAEGFGD